MKRKLTPLQKVILSEIPDFFQWHEHCQRQVEELLENVIVGNHVVSLKEQYKEDYNLQDEH